MGKASSLPSSLWASDPDPAWFGGWREGWDGVELPQLPHVALSLECGGLICSGWEAERRMAPWALDVARRGVSLLSSARGLLSSVRFQPLCHLLLLPCLLSYRLWSWDIFLLLCLLPVVYSVVLGSWTWRPPWVALRLRDVTRSLAICSFFS